MVDLSGAIQQMVMLFVVAIVGYVAAKLGYLDMETKNKLTRLLLNITLPCMIVASVDGLSLEEAGSLVPWAFALSAAQFFLLLACGVLCCALLRVPAHQRREYVFMCLCTNTGFIGIPVVAALYGTESVLFSSIFVMVISAFFYSIGLMVIAPQTDGSDAAGASTDAAAGAEAGAKKGSRGIVAALRAVPWRSIVNPCMVGCLVALALFFAQVELPDLVVDTLDMIGGITSPVALMLVGVIMANVDLKSVVGELRLYPFILIRQLVVPAVLYFVLMAIVPSELLVGVFTIMFSMPVGSMASLFVEMNGGDSELVAKGTILSTAGSFACIPALVAIMTML